MKKILLLLILFIINVNVCSAEISYVYSKSVNEDYKTHIVDSVKKTQAYFKEYLKTEVSDAKIYVVTDRKELKSLLHTQYESFKNHEFAGYSMVDSNIILLIIPNNMIKQNITYLVAHEMTHKIQNQMNPWKSNETWFIEGTACYVGYRVSEIDKSRVNISALEDINVNELKDWQKSSQKYGYQWIYERSWWEVFKISFTKSDYQIFEEFNVINKKNIVSGAL